MTPPLVHIILDNLYCCLRRLDPVNNESRWERHQQLIDDNIYYRDALLTTQGWLSLFFPLISTPLAVLGVEHVVTAGGVQVSRRLTHHRPYTHTHTKCGCPSLSRLACLFTVCLR